jgi:hypothetical protein
MLHSTLFPFCKHFAEVNFSPLFALKLGKPHLAG